MAFVRYAGSAIVWREIEVQKNELWNGGKLTMATATKRQTQRAEGRRSEPPARASSQPNRQSVRTTQDRQPREHQERDGQEQTGLANINGEKLARGLGWFSIGLGLAEVLAPRGIAKIAGVRGNHTGLIRLFGLREIASGIGIFAQGRRPAAAVWSRVAGDALDLAALGAAFASPRSSKGRVAFATANVLAVTALDLLCAQQLGKSATAGEHGVNVESFITINRSPVELYRLWREPRILPQIMGHFAEINTIGEDSARWSVRAPLGQSIEWDARIVEDRPDEFVRWESAEGASVPNEGSVQFRPAPAGRGTEVRLSFRFDPPGGVLGSAAASLLSLVPDALAAKALRRFKALAETGEIPTTENQPAARDGGRGK